MNETERPAPDDDDGDVTDADDGHQTEQEEDDLEQLFADSRRQAQQPSPNTGKSDNSDEIAELKATVNALLQTQQTQALRSDLESAVGAIAGHSETLSDLHGKDPSYIEAQLRLEAANEPEVQRLYENKQSDPASWNKFLKGFAKKLDKKASVFSGPPVDRAAAEAAARGASAPEEAPEVPDQKELARMARDPEKWAEFKEGYFNRA